MSGCEKVEFSAQTSTESEAGNNNGDDDNGDEDDAADDEEPYDTEIPGFLVNTMPRVGDVWNGHVVAYVDANCLALLVSVAEWMNVPSAFSEGDNEAAEDIARAYSEGGIRQWMIPNREEAKLLRAVWNAATLPLINQALIKIGSTPLDTTDRYLCESAAYTFSFSENSNITKAGTKKEYRLRLVKRVRFIP